MTLLATFIEYKNDFTSKANVFFNKICFLFSIYGS